MRKYLVFAAVAAVLWPSAGVAAATGELDDSFGGDGTVSLDVAGGEPDELAAGRKGRLWVAVGVSTPFDGEVVIARLLEDGSYDSGFSDDGQRTWKVPPGGDTFTSVSSMRAVGNGVQVSGHWFDQTDGSLSAYVAAFGSHGALDKSYGDGGYITRQLPSGFQDAPQLSPDGRYLCAAPKNGSQLRIFALEVDGSPEVEFGDGGSVVLPHDRSFRLGGCGTSPAGGPYVVSTGNRESIQLQRLTPEGAPDEEFGPGGVVELSSVGAYVRPPVFLADGGVLMAGVASYDGSTHPAAVKIRPDGTIDSDYGGGDGVAVGTADELAHVRDYSGGGGSHIAVRPDGAVATTGLSDPDNNGNSTPYVAMFTPRGRPAKSFDGDGGITGFIATAGYTPDSALFDQRRRLLIGAHGGTQGQPPEVARFVR